MTVDFTQAQEIKKIAHQEDIPAVDVKRILDRYISDIRSSVKSNGKASINNLGTFRVRKHHAYIGRNPRTGEKVNVPAKMRIHFTASTIFKAEVNEEFNTETESNN
ncbi:HU family DNA-binding protein [Lactobacillus sanfranciscensis]|uniref:DNA-binding protein HU n=1 Tax=Fructilactobacillus sanfranciscensis (strain TMW 1.1304) TaxID=714313 RepID=G2KWV3_FRUST|nr:HU family DNA-binding protein [Fructilactobacillus sanfranciscensis]AEN99750.1 hypothetical protein LSA_2p00530 [Fructilactobacillus sanfranciscensis TMW 1.1304]NDR76246.1 HU family DNA-binding protein [Fructilactobacillus sanfranciscensis]NDS04780.1 HU family DNA-binding protein [Fructilactobacillus sanfranciscensis]POH19668.1 hypothetical protein BGL44_05385 [Fructilactobacillus sanfranciscensis]